MLYRWIKMFELMLMSIFLISLALNVFYYKIINKNKIQLESYRNNIQWQKIMIVGQGDIIKQYDYEIIELYQNKISLENRTSIIIYGTKNYNSFQIALKECKNQQTNNGNTEKVAYLTFDDGPTKYTEQILDILKACNVKATFFVIGNRAKSYPNIIKRMIQEGHQVANHSHSHNYKTIYASEKAFTNELELTNKLIYNLTGINNKFFRFPGGSSTTTTKFSNIKKYIEILKNKGFYYYDWNVSSGDDTAQSAKGIVNNITKGIKSKDIVLILMHDTKKAMLEALPEVINTLKKNDFKIELINKDSYKAQHVK